MSSVVPEGWSLKPVGEMISESRIALAQDNSSKRLAVRLNLNGIGKRSERATDQVGATKYFSRRAGQFVYGKQNLHKGAFGIIPYSFDGFSSSQDIPTFDFNVDVHPYWFNQYFQQKDFYEGLERIASGTGSKRIQPKDLYLEVLLTPPLPEQKKIASILTSVDEVIDNTQKQIDKLQDLKKATMNELLTKGIGHTEFKDSELGRIPKSWEVINLGSISQVVDSMHQTPTFSDHGKAMVRVTEIRNGEFIDISSAVNVNEETYKAFTKNYKPRFGDILIARVGAYFGATTYVDKEVTFCLGQNTAAIRPKDIESDFLFFFINSECVSNQMNDVVSVGAQPSLSLEVIKKIKVVCPPDSEQKLIAKSIFSITSKIINTNLKLSQTQSLKKSLMQDLLTGKVRVTVN